MPQELFYTSVPRGLDQGACGFCTVQRTVGLDVVVQRQLEALSAFGSTASATGFQNGEIVLHTSVVGPKGTYRVLSKVSVGGEDYSGRSNLLAHHLVLSVAECPPCGPAMLASAPGVLKSSWDGRVSQIAARTLPPVTSSASTGLNSWRSGFGDPGWAGVVLFELSRQNPQPVWVIVPDGTDSLRLITELSGCLEPDERWNLTFATEYQPLPAGTQCVLRFLSGSSSLVENLIRRGGPGMIDLSRRRTSIPAEAAAMADEIRAGRTVRLKSRTENLSNTKSAANPDGEADLLLQMARQEARQRNRAAAASGAMATPGLLSSTGNPQAAHVWTGGDQTEAKAVARRNLFRITGLIALSLATLAICGSGTAWVMHQKRVQAMAETARLEVVRKANELREQAKAKSRLHEAFKTAGNNLEESLANADRFLLAPLRTTASESAQAGRKPQDVATTFSQRLRDAKEIATKDRDELLKDRDGYLAAWTAYNDAPPTDETKDAKLTDRCDKATRNLLQMAASLKSLSDAIELIGRRTVPKSRDEAKEILAELKRLNSDDSLKVIEPKVADSDGLDALIWIRGRIAEHRDFDAGPLDHFDELPFVTEAEGFLVRVPCHQTSEGPFVVTLIIPAGMSDLIDAKVITVKAERNIKRGEDTFLNLHISNVPETVSKSALSAMLCVHITGELMDTLVVREVQSKWMTPEMWTPEILCRVHQADFEMLLRKHRPGLVNGRRVQNSSESPPELQLTLKLNAGQDAVPPSNPATPLEASTAETARTLPLLLDEHALTFWRQATLRGEGLFFANPRQTPGDEYNDLLKSRLDESLLNASKTLKDSLPKRNFDNLKYAITNRTSDPQKELNEILEEVEKWRLQTSRTSLSKKWKDHVITASEMLDREKAALEEILKILEPSGDSAPAIAAIEPDTEQRGMSPRLVKAIEAANDELMALVNDKSDAKQSPEFQEILRATHVWKDAVIQARKIIEILAVLDDAQLSIVAEEWQWFDAVQEQTITLKQLQLEYVLPDREKSVIRPLKFERDINVKLPLKDMHPVESGKTDVEPSKGKSVE